MEFFAYDSIKEFMVYFAFGWAAALCLYSYGYLIVCGVKWAVKKLKKRFRKNHSEEETVNE